MGREEESKYNSKRWIGCPIEEEYLGEDRKQGKTQRKIASSKDRSKYKKTDRDKKEMQALAPVDTEGLIRGRVLSIASQGITVDCEGIILNCSLRGLLKKDKSQFKNLVVVGDFVLVQKLSNDEGLIFSVEPRTSVLSRADNLSRRKEQLIAANIDQVIVTASVMTPPLKPFLVDRYIIAARKGGMEPIIIVNKVDLLEDSSFGEELLLPEKELYEEFMRAYSAANEKVIAVSAKTGEGMDELKKIMQGKASVFSGQSGVGKSSLINAMTGLDLRVGQVVEKTQKGAHTTSTANLLPLPFGGWCIDTPGIKSFGIWDLKKEEIASYFTEIYECGHGCRYPDCTHRNEPGCAVLEAVEKEKISWLRYQSYEYLVDSVSKEHKRR